MQTLPAEIELAQRLANRLERLSADSYWSHQASGLRGALLRCMEQLESDSGSTSLEHLHALSKQGYWILVQAALELTSR